MCVWKGIQGGKGCKIRERKGKGEREGCYEGSLRKRRSVWKGRSRRKKFWKNRKMNKEEKEEEVVKTYTWSRNKKKKLRIWRWRKIRWGGTRGGGGRGGSVKGNVNHSTSYLALF